MGSTGDADRKRRHCSSISASPTGTAAKKQAFMPLSEDKKLDAAVLQFQNQKLVQKLETQKLEINCLEDNICKLKEKQLPYDNTLAVVRKSWVELVDDLESETFISKDQVRCEQGVGDLLVQSGISSEKNVASLEDEFLNRLLVTGATESSSSGNTADVVGGEQPEDGGRLKNVLHKIVAAMSSHWLLKNQLYTGVSSSHSKDRLHALGTSFDLYSEVKNLRLEINSLLEKHSSFSRELQNHLDLEAKNKSKLAHLKEELEHSIMELEENNRNLAIIKVEKDASNGASFPILNMGNRPVSSDKARDKLKELQEMEASLKVLQDQSSNRLLELKLLNEERMRILKQLCALQNTLKNFKGICSSEAYCLLKDQLLKAKDDVVHYRALYEKLQVERDVLSWREKETYLKNELMDLYHRSSDLTQSKISELEKDIQRHVDEKNSIEAKLEEALKEQSRKEIIEEFKTLVSSFPNEMATMQSQLNKYKESASDIHALRADVKSLSSILERKTKELEKLSATSAEQAAEVKKLQGLVHYLEQSDMELNLMLQMFRRESTSSRDLLEARESEYTAWAQVQSLKSSLDERNLELQVKSAIEAEATAEQRLAASDAEITELRQMGEFSRRESSSLTEVLQSKNEEIEAYLSEIETIGQAYDDMQTQNQQLLWQITEGDDYITKLVLEGIQTRQLGDCLNMEKEIIGRSIQLANAASDFHSAKASRIEDLLKTCSGQIQRLAENREKSSAVVENNQKRVVDVRKSSQQAIETLEKLQSQVDRSRVNLADVQIELENERFERKREEEDLEFARSKISSLNSEADESSIVHKLREELKEYREILKCSICLDRRKEVVIGKCYHLFCNPCIQKIIDTRHRKCPVCSSSFGVNDVKAVYI